MSDENLINQSQILPNQTEDRGQQTKVKLKNMKSLISSELNLNEQKSVILYTAANGKVTADVLFAQDNFWLTQKTMSELFGVEKAAISKHLKNIYASNELNQEATVSILETVQMEAQRAITRKLEIYNLDAVIAVGYRVNSIKATHFRIWAT